MRQTESKILNRLLDRYENSKLWRGENVKNIHITFAFCKDTIPKYFDESSLAADEINASMQQLQRDGLIDIRWKNGKVGYIIEKVELRCEAVDAVYERLGRVPKASAQVDAITLLQERKERTTGCITHAFIDRMTERIANGKSVKEYLDIMDLEPAEKLIFALSCVENNKAEAYIREFSITHFHDSKTFETLIPKICRIIREERPEFATYENEDILSEYMIYKTPGYVYIKGPATLVTPAGDEIYVGAFLDGIGFAVGHTQEAGVRVIPDASVREVYTIENLTSFYRFQKENSLIVYLGGYHNSVRRQLLLDIYHALPEARYYHFGDIDAGGFQIFYHLREKTGIPFRTYQMDIATLKAYEDYVKPLTDSDRKRIKLLCETKLTDEEKCVAEYMLAKGIKLEQECVGIGMH